MDIIPAVDLKNGKCVRLYQGDYTKETIYADDPVTIAQQWYDTGARRLHIVDLDGAKSGRMTNAFIIERIVKQIAAPIQVGGGIRDESTVKRLLDMGIKRVILGTIAIEQPEIIDKLCAKYGDAIIVGIDARDGYVATRGWYTETQRTAVDLGLEMKRRGVQRILYTDIKRDGTLTEPNFAAITELSEKLQIAVIAAGGISSLDHIRKLMDCGIDGAILGKALYTGHINLEEALAAQK
ncbi:MAG TPA: 1-(5-phosphoribosyl)-5-((5-phosphoribosylamino)methylideneamino)imidazole-4-carboxamide isomerase [Dehalococcoidia bacterium]|nr:1-(5-phosphoribosyl)-5-((5-phosphoribosylamino)methylideneamino)imidazole-4-carboxamide isomerase [Dehalococcoidia bacterium]